MNRPPAALRAFVAISAPTEVLATLAEVQRELKTLLPRHSTAWTKPGNLHLTLRFLGNLSAPAVRSWSNACEPRWRASGAFDLICERLGCFPDLRSPRVVWAWVHDATERLQQLQRRVDAAVREFAGKPAEARFVGHITLARPKQIKRPEAERLAQFLEASVNRRFGNWTTREVWLLRSELSPGGSKYHALARLGLE